MAHKQKRRGDYTLDDGYVPRDACEVYCEKCTRGMLGPRQEYWDAGLIQGETDSPDHCCNCGVLLPTSLTFEGMKYVREKVWNQEGDTEILDLWRSRFDYAFDHEIETFAKEHDCILRPEGADDTDYDYVFGVNSELPHGTVYTLFDDDTIKIGKHLVNRQGYIVVR